MTDTRFVGVSSQDLIDELTRRSHAIVVGVALLTTTPDRVDVKFHRSGSYFAVEGLATILMRQCAADSNRAVGPVGPVAGIDTPILSTIKTLGIPGRNQ